VLSTLENQVRLRHELVLDAWDEMRSRGAAVIHVTDREYERARQLVNEILPAEGPEAVTLRRAQDPVARAIIEMIAQEVAPGATSRAAAVIEDGGRGSEAAGTHGNRGGG
jgi:DNA-binding MurR/RpiR family transcriptional regulator